MAGDQLLATIDKPAVVTVQAPPRPASPDTDKSERLILRVTGFKPGQDASAIQVIVKAEKADGTEQEIHRFGLFPEKAFSAADAAKAQSFGFSLPKDLASDGPVKLKIELVPLRGRGTDASLQVGSVDWESRR